jgi:hypothetical protein
MNFTPRIRAGSVVGGILMIAVVGVIGWGSHVASTPIVANQNATAVAHSPIVPAVLVSAPGFQEARSYYYQPVTAWYKNKHWWKRNAPIIGGAGGGALVGGLLGGGKGALIGGAVGGGGGYLYKRSKRHQQYYRHHQ